MKTPPHAVLSRVWVSRDAERKKSSVRFGWKTTNLNRAIPIILFMLCACKSEEQKAYEQVARDANPILTMMRPTALALASIHGDDAAATAEIIRLCKSADEALWKLRDVRIPPGYMIAIHASYLLDERKMYCRPDNGDPLRVSDCRRQCLELWQLLISEVGDLQADASREGVELVLLSSLTKKQAYEQIAPEVNSILTALRPTAALMLRDLPAMENTPASTAKIIVTCGSDPALRRLRDVKFDIQERRISESAQHLLKLSEFACLTSSDTDISPDQCRERCLSVWQYLRKDVDTLRTAASKEGVEIVQLFP